MSEAQNFKFILTQGSVVLFEKIFDGNMFTQHTREYVDIRKMLSSADTKKNLPSIINQLQKVLSKNNYSTKEYGYNYLAEYLKDIDTFPANVRGELEYNPESVAFNVERNGVNGVENITIRGVECKIGFYRNDTKIVERLFYVDRFNPIARWSVDLTNTCEYIVNNIQNHIKNSDIAYLWSEYDKLVESTDELVVA